MQSAAFAGLSQAEEALDALEANGHAVKGAEFSLSGTFRVWWSEDDEGQAPSPAWEVGPPSPSASPAGQG